MRLYEHKVSSTAWALMRFTYRERCPPSSVQLSQKHPRVKLKASTTFTEGMSRVVIVSMSILLIRSVGVRRIFRRYGAGTLSMWYAGPVTHTSVAFGKLLNVERIWLNTDFVTASFSSFVHLSHFVFQDIGGREGAAKEGEIDGWVGLMREYESALAGAVDTGLELRSHAVAASL